MASRLHDCLIAAGSNLGDRVATLQEAARRLTAAGGVEVVSQSRPFESPAIGGPAEQQPFVNLALRVRTSHTPQELLKLLQSVETQLGRRREVRWGPRTLDLDLLLYDNRRIETEELIVPHPRLAWRRFVLEPAAEIAGRMVHPLLGVPISKLHARLLRRPQYVAIAGDETSSARDLAARVVEALNPVAGRIVVHVADPVGDSGGAAPEADCLRLGSDRLDTALEALERRRSALVAALAEAEAADSGEGSPAGLPTPAPLVVSDFWFDQSLADLAGELSAAEWARFYERWRIAEAELPPPTLVAIAPWAAGRHRSPSTARRSEPPVGDVLTPNAPSAERPQSGRSPTPSASVAPVGRRLRRRALFAGLLNAARGYPLVWLDRDESLTAEHQLLAAIEAMTAPLEPISP